MQDKYREIIIKLKNKSRDAAYERKKAQKSEECGWK